jgi:cytochrome c-type biogenesis protein CcmH/NrfG
MPAGENMLIERLAVRTEGDAQDQRGWLMPARSYAGLGRFSEAAQAYRHAIEFGSNDPAILTA